MTKKILQIIESAYRGTIEEQDDTVVWLTHLLKGENLSADVLLRGNAVNYLAKGQDASGLAFGDRKQTQPPQLADDVIKLTEKGITIYFVQDDAARLGLESSDMIPGAKPIPGSGIAKLFAGYDQIWHW